MDEAYKLYGLEIFSHISHVAGGLNLARDLLFFHLHQLKVCRALKLEQLSVGNIHNDMFNPIKIFLFVGSEFIIL